MPTWSGKLDQLREPRIAGRGLGRRETGGGLVHAGIGSVPRVSSERVARPVDELSGAYGERVRFVKANAVKANAIASKHNVYSIPAMVVFRGGKIVKQQVGAASEDSLKSTIDSAIA